MGFLSGQLSFVRYKVGGHRPGQFGQDHLDKLAEFPAGRDHLGTHDGIAVGWTAGDHILDQRFDFAKNICNDTLHFALRTDIDRIPGDLLKAYYQVEIEAVAATNPSGRPSLRQKREAREAARERLEDEARDGRFRQRRAFPVLWDGVTNELLVGTTSMAGIDRLKLLFEKTFGPQIEPITAGSQAYVLAEIHDRGRGVDDARPTPFVPGGSSDTVSWVPDDRSRDFLGNEFVLWLWYTIDVEGDLIALPDGSDVTVMMTRTLSLECPRGLTGKETITHEGPARLPEARRAIQAGKLPRKCGLTMVRHNVQYELTFTPETLGISGGKMPAPEGENDQVRHEERINQLRSLIETMDLLYDAYCRQRASDDWHRIGLAIGKWLQREERQRLAAIG